MKGRVKKCGEGKERCGDVGKCWLLEKVWEIVLGCGGGRGMWESVGRDVESVLECGEVLKEVC